MTFWSDGTGGAAFFKFTIKWWKWWFRYRVTRDGRAHVGYGRR